MRKEAGYYCKEIKMDAEKNIVGLDVSRNCKECEHVRAVSVEVFENVCIHCTSKKIIYVCGFGEMGSAKHKAFLCAECGGFTMVLPPGVKKSIISIQGIYPEIV